MEFWGQREKQRRLWKGE